MEKMIEAIPAAVQLDRRTCQNYVFSQLCSVQADRQSMKKKFSDGVT